jgi:hypothetical protein
LRHRSHDFHRSCVQSYAEHAILREGRWRVRCPHSGCAYQLYTSDVRELCGPTSSAFTAFSQLKTADYAERLRQVQAGQEVDAATRDWIAANCDVCPGCQVRVHCASQRLRMLCDASCAHACTCSAAGDRVQRCGMSEHHMHLRRALRAWRAPPHAVLKLRERRARSCSAPSARRGTQERELHRTNCRPEAARTSASSAANALCGDFAFQAGAFSGRT